MFSRPVRSGWKPVPNSSRPATRPCVESVPLVGWMTRLINFTIVAAVAAAMFAQASFAQASAPAARAEVKAETKAAEKAGKLTPAGEGAGPTDKATAKSSKTRAERLESDARTRSQMLDSETSERRSQLMGDLEKEKVRLNGEIETLRTFEREYRSRLKSYFSQQLAALDTGASEGGSNSSYAAGGEAPKRLKSLLGDDQG